jgi:hypothetical protein
MIPLVAKMVVLQVAQSRFTLALIGKDSFKLIQQTACDCSLRLARKARKSVFNVIHTSVEDVHCCLDIPSTMTEGSEPTREQCIVSPMGQTANPYGQSRYEFTGFLCRPIMDF